MIDHPFYYIQKEEAFRAGDAVKIVGFVESLAMVFEASEEISGGRAAELMEMVTHLLKCRKACESHGLMREVIGLDKN